MNSPLSKGLMIWLGKLATQTSTDIRSRSLEDITPDPP
jgi:hypothetical protein